MKSRLFTKIAAVFFGIGALAHVSRLVTGWQIEVGGMVVPVWVSGVGVVIASLFAAMLWRESHPHG